MNNKKTISILMIFTIIFTVIGGSLAFWNWNSSEAQRTNVVFTMERDFSCAVDGGGNITETDVTLAPTTCTDTTRAIKRTVKVTPTLNRDDLSINMDLWLDVNSIGSGLSESQNFRYVLTTSSTSCEEGTILSSGTFNEKTAGSRVEIMNKKTYTETTTDTYYLYIWLDKEETNSNTMNQSFSLSLNGSCTNSPQPEAPDLDNGMIPVTISANGTVKTVDKDDASWYDYDEKQWANAILVNSEKRSSYLNTNGVTVAQDDILAYYVWIPRYSYMIQEKKCFAVDNPTLETYPECYTRTMSDSDKELLANWLVSNFPSYMASYYSLELALEDVEDGLQTGTFICKGSNGFPGNTYQIDKAVSSYNDESEEQITTYSAVYNENNDLSASSPRTIDIMFESKTASLSAGNAKNTYRTHPAFWWDDNNDGDVDAGEMVSGIWVGKFETTGNATTPTVKPNVASLRSQNVSTQFATSQKFSADGNPYGINYTNTNAHMMKNSEWGAAAYLSRTKYGINGEIRINNYWVSSATLTGCGAETENATQNNTECEVPYGSVADGTYPQSSTGNISGIFDMSGGALEHVMGNYNDTIVSSGFTAMPAKKYYDKYTFDATNSCTLATCGGHALYETKAWYGDYAGFVDSDGPWFDRGGYFNNGAGAGAFNFSYGTGGGFVNASWRSVLVVGHGA